MCIRDRHYSSDPDLTEEQCQQTEVLNSDGSSVCEKTQIIIEKNKRLECTTEQIDHNLLIARPGRTDSSRSGLRPVPEEDEEHPPTTDSVTSTTSTVTSVLKPCSLISCENKNDSITHLQNSTETVMSQHSQEPVVITGPRSISFHERATTKDVIDELNRMIRKGEDGNEADGTTVVNNLDVACCCPTGWVHVDREIDFTDPKVNYYLIPLKVHCFHLLQPPARLPSSLYIFHNIFTLVQVMNRSCK